MKVNVYLTEDGQKAVAGGDEPAWSWHFQVLPVNNYGQAFDTKNIQLLEGLELPLPLKEVVLPAVVAGLRVKEQAIYAEAEKEAARVREELQNLLAISYEEQP